MKWSDLTLKERKQIYDAVRAENPNASYFDIKSQFDSIPAYEEGKDNSVAAVYSLPEVTIYPQNRFGDIARTQGYETAKNWQAVRNGTTAGINEFVNDPRTQFVLTIAPLPSGLEGTEAALNVVTKPINKGINYVKEAVQDVKDISNLIKRGESVKELLDPRFSSRRKYLEKAYSEVNKAAEAVKNTNIISEKNINDIRNKFVNKKPVISFAQEKIENGNFNAKIYGRNYDKLAPEGSTGGHNVGGFYRNNKPAKYNTVLKSERGNHIKYRTPISEISEVASHEFQHEIQGLIPNKSFSAYDPTSGYWVPNESSFFGKEFKNVLSGKPGDWVYSPDEVLAERMMLMLKNNNLVSKSRAAQDYLIKRFDILPEKRQEFLDLLYKLDKYEFLDKVPTFEDGGKKKNNQLLRELGYVPGTPEYYDRQRKISGRVETVQPEAYLTPVGYVKDAITTAEELEKGNYGNAAISTLMNFIPWGVGKGLKKLKSRVSNTLNTPIEIHSSMVDEYPSILAERARSKISKNKKKVKEESDYDSEFSEVIRRDRNIKKYEKEISKTIEDAILPDKKTYELVKGIDTAYGTDYLDAYKRIAARDMTKRGKYIKYAELPGNKNAKISRVRDVQDYGPVVDDYVITIDPLQYLPGTANHELGHLADQLASDANNRYLTYLLDEGNIMGPGELRNKGININPNMQAYLLDPSESKSHMLHLKRALVNEGKIHDWSSKVNQNTIEDFLFDPRNTGVVNNANKLQYNMYRNKSRFVDRINNLTPMEFITPLLLPVAGYEINKE
nr:MAG: hypothetical protein [Bacteriophage sp.]